MLAIPITGLCSVIQLCLFATPWTIAHQAPRSMEFSRQEYWSGLPFSTPGDLPDPGIELLHLLHGQGVSLPLWSPGECTKTDKPKPKTKLTSTPHCRHIVRDAQY